MEAPTNSVTIGCGSIHIRPTYGDLIIRTHLKTEQTFLASRDARRENKRLETAFHKWVVVKAESDDGFRVFQDKGNDLDDQPYLYPFSMLILKWVSSGDNIKKGCKVVEGFDRGKLAVALEAIKCLLRSTRNQLDSLSLSLTQEHPIQTTYWLRDELGSGTY